MNTAAKRKIGVFTIASKNYLAYVRVLLNSVAAMHPEYELYLCLVDAVDAAFVPEAESFHVIQSDRIGAPHFDDMALRYDIMELNTAVKPFMFQWLLDHTDLASIIYLDPDIQLYSPLGRLEEVLQSEVSMVLTPHITMPIEDGRNPNDHHMLQSGVFNLGFAAVNRCDDARRFLQWWGRRLQTQACADIPGNLFTDQRWCDLAPCFVERLHILKDPGYNVAYWNLTERRVARSGGQWLCNGGPLAFFHFSGLVAEQPAVFSKHQNRFSIGDLPDLEPLFDEYRRALIRAGWNDTRRWPYAYASTTDGLPVPTVVRRLYRREYPEPQVLAPADTSGLLLRLCNSAVSVGTPGAGSAAVSKLMHFIYHQRPDLQAAFNLHSPDGMTAFRAWFASAGAREFGLPGEFLSVQTSGERPEPRTAAPAPESAGRLQAPNAALPKALDSSVVDIWDRLPERIRRLLAPAISRLVTAAAERETPTQPAAGQEAGNATFAPPSSSRMAALLEPAPLPQLSGTGRPITVAMHLAWLSDAGLQKAFDLGKAGHQRAFLAWFDVSRRRAGPIPLDARTPAKARPGVNLIGYAHAEMGMGEHVRMSAAALDQTPVPFGVVDFNVGLDARQEATLDHGRIIAGNPHAANLFHINADRMFVAYTLLGHEFFARRYNIGYWAWELARFPPEMTVAAKLVDELWAPSRFIQQALRDSVEVPVEYMPLCVELPAIPPVDRSAFALPPRAFVFLYSFDFLSFMERKNPFAAVRAFRMAFPDRKSEASLVLKVMHGNGDSPAWRQLVELIDDDARIRIINRTMSRSEMLALLATSDCYVSLHRSEGFGRGPAEAMYLGKPVIATNYSGNTDFTLADNSCLVDFTLIPVREGQYPCYAGQQWADADVEQAAWYMQKLTSDPAFSRELGARGRALIHDQFNPRVIGSKYAARLRMLGLV